MKKFRFYKETDNRWYVDLPEWDGEKEALEMVAGADTMLEYMAEGEVEVSVLMSEEEFENADNLHFIRYTHEFGEGAIYMLYTYKGIEINLEIWLCDVTKFVFDHFPDEIYILKIDG